MTNKVHITSIGGEPFDLYEPFTIRGHHKKNAKPAKCDVCGETSLNSFFVMACVRILPRVTINRVSAFPLKQGAQAWR